MDATTGQEVRVQLEGDGRPLEERVAVFFGNKSKIIRKYAKKLDLTFCLFL